LSVHITAHKSTCLNNLRANQILLFAYVFSTLIQIPSLFTEVNTGLDAYLCNTYRFTDTRKMSCGPDNVTGDKCYQLTKL